jgi:long-chain acyl-CoA synthetase
VREASVFGIPYERLGEKLAVRISLNPGKTLSQEELSSFLEKKIAKFKIPELAWFQDEELPKVAAGKIAKKDMREEAIKELGLN